MTFVCPTAFVCMKLLQPIIHHFGKFENFTFKLIKWLSGKFLKNIFSCLRTKESFFELIAEREIGKKRGEGLLISVISLLKPRKDV